jgi:hypothetical protein
MAIVYEANGSFHLRVDSKSDVKKGTLLPAGPDRTVLKKRQSVQLCRKDDGLYRTKNSPAVQRKAADKQDEIKRWEDAYANGDSVTVNPYMTVADFYYKESFRLRKSWSPAASGRTQQSNRINGIGTRT